MRDAQVATDEGGELDDLEQQIADAEIREGF